MNSEWQPCGYLCKLLSTRMSGAIGHKKCPKLCRASKPPLLVVDKRPWITALQIYDNKLTLPNFQSENYCFSAESGLSRSTICRSRSMIVSRRSRNKERISKKTPAQTEVPAMKASELMKAIKRPRAITNMPNMPRPDCLRGVGFTIRKDDLEIN